MHQGTTAPLHESEWIFDERRMIVVNARDLTPYQFQLYKRNTYKRLRPDLTSWDFLAWKEKYRMGENLLTYTRSRLNNETQKAALLGLAAHGRENVKVT
jgi:hypothetical protein